MFTNDCLATKQTQQNSPNSFINISSFIIIYQLISYSKKQGVIKNGGLPYGQ